MKKLRFYVVIFVVAALFSGCGQVVPPDKGGDGSDSGKQVENAEKRIYWFDDNAKTETQSGIVYSVNLGYKDKRQEFGIPKPEPQSNYALKTGFVFYPYVNIVSISKNKEFIFLSTEFGKGFDIENGETYLVDGKKVYLINVTEYSIYEPSTKEFHYIGASCQYIFDYNDSRANYKEIGHKYYPAGWIDDELLLVETTKDEKMYTMGQDAAVKIEEILSIEVPYATAKAVSFSLKDFTLSPTDTFKPLKPWTSYSDTNTGIVGYFDPFYPFRQFLFIDYPTYGSVVTTLTDFKGEKTYDLYELAKEALPKDYVLGKSNFCGAMIDKDGRRMCYYCMEGYPKEILKYKPNDPVWRESYPPIPRREYIIFGLDFDTGKIEKYMTTDQIISEVKRLYGGQHKDLEILIKGFGGVADGITKGTGPLITIGCAIIYKVNDSDKIVTYVYKFVGPKLNKLEVVEKDYMMSPFFIR